MQKMISRILIVFVISIVSVLSIGAKTLVIDDFDGEQLQNKLGYHTGTWAENGAEISVSYVSVRDDSESYRGDSALKITYEFNKTNQVCGWWCALGDRDYSVYDRVMIWIKYEEKNDIFIGIKDNNGFETFVPLHKFPSAKKGVWHKVVIPIKHFGDINNWTSFNNLTLAFFSTSEETTSGSVYVDDIRFEGPPGAEPKAPPKRFFFDMIDIDHSTNSEFLDLVERAAFEYFKSELNPENGLVKDKASSFYKDNFNVASVAASGFALTAYCVGVERGWMTKEEAYTRALKTVSFFKEKVVHKEGFYFHFLNMKTGEREYASELSSIDTALFIAGVLFVGEYFKGTEVEKIAKELYERVNWQWMLDEHDTLSMGWKPESGFLDSRWEMYCELKLLLLLAMGSPTHPIPESLWKVWDRNEDAYADLTFFHCPPLFTHQYSFIWIDFRNKKDLSGDYFANSIKASLANRQWCIDEQNESESYNKNSWGLTACDGQKGYRAYGAPYGYEDGTVAPTGAIGSIVFAPDQVIDTMRSFYRIHGKKIWGRFGFTDSFNLDKKWYSPYTLAIDQGTMLLMIENYRSQFVWNIFMKIPAIKDALKRAGFEDYIADYDDVLKESLEKLEPEKPELDNAA
ncbi:glucoamylase family protein [Chlamydiota bacterium]